MRHPFMMFAVLVAAFTGAFAHPKLADADSKSPKTEARMIDFHSGQSLGSLSLAKTGEDRYHDDAAQLSISGQRTPIGPALGKMTIQIPRNTMLCFEPNRRIFDNPSLIENIADKIDVLFVQASAADDSENGRSDRLLTHIGHMQNLRELYTSRSDVTDRGLAQLPPLKSLELFGAWLNPLNGSCLEHLAQEPNMRSLMLWGTGMSESNLKYLPSMRKLAYLNVADLNMTSTGLAYVSKCLGLKELHMAFNKKIGDDDLKLLLPLKQLVKLDLRGSAITDKGLLTLVKLKQLKWLVLTETSVTAAGISALRPLHLEHLAVSDRRYTETQLAIIKQVCSTVVFEKNGTHKVDKFTKRMFAPVSMHGQI